MISHELSLIIINTYIYIVLINVSKFDFIIYKTIIVVSYTYRMTLLILAFLVYIAYIFWCLFNLSNYHDIHK